jgi:DNA-binding NarL/FixJ family response regulator
MINTPLSPIRLLIADDHEVLREGFCSILNGNKEIELVGAASNGVELIELTERLMPDIIITDIRMPVMNGFEATKILTAKYPGIGVIIFTICKEEKLVIDMLEAGVQGYLIKNSGKKEILEAIYAVMNQKTYYCRETTALLTQVIAKNGVGRKEKRGYMAFNHKEKEIICLICEGKSNKEIAAKLNLSIRTVEGYREKIEYKMGVKNTAGIVVYAIKNGIFQL